MYHEVLICLKEAYELAVYGIPPDKEEKREKI